MSKTLDIVMAGVISGIVAFTTTQIGIAGTVIGAVLGAMLYQIMTHFIREPLGNLKTQKIETRIVFILPLIIILVIELLYLLSSIYWEPQKIIEFLQGATGWNLFRSIGFGLILMGLYSIIVPENIKRKYGFILLFVGIIKLLNGFIDVKSPLVKAYSILFIEFREIISVIVILALLYVIVKIFMESVILIREDDQSSNSSNNSENYDQKS